MPLGGKTWGYLGEKQAKTCGGRKSDGRTPRGIEGVLQEKRKPMNIRLENKVPP